MDQTFRGLSTASDGSFVTDTQTVQRWKNSGPVIWLSRRGEVTGKVSAGLGAVVVGVGVAMGVGSGISWASPDDPDAAVDSGALAGSKSSGSGFSAGKSRRVPVAVAASGSNDRPSRVATSSGSENSVSPRLAPQQQTQPAVAAVAIDQGSLSTDMATAEAVVAPVAVEKVLLSQTTNAALPIPLAPQLAPAPAPVAMPRLPLVPLLPVSPAGVASVSSWSATGRNRDWAVALPAAANSTDVVDALGVTPAHHVLVIGVDGTNLAAILADEFNTSFFDLMNTGTSAASTIIGHTTVSNPSWTGVLTGVWSEQAGVSNNVFTPWTYDTWPTIFNQLETYNPAIQTSAIADWANIAQIAGAGSIPADYIRYFAPVDDDFLASDDEVGAESVNVIRNTVAGTSSFQFTYFVGVDNTGHEFDAGSPQYANALRNVDQNIGAMMAEIAAWESVNPGEQWTVIVTTDHGQVPWSTLKIGPEMRAHGFQTPWETTTFVIANGPGFAEGAINNTYSNIDITPTVAALLGIAPEPYSAGQPLMSLAGNNYQPVIAGIDAIKQALTDAVQMYGYPDIATNISLVIRTVAATIPFVVFTVFDALATSVPEFLQLPVQFIGDIFYQMVNIPAQIIVRLTGVTGNDIIPPSLWPYYPTPNDEPLTAALTAAACSAWDTQI